MSTLEADYLEQVHGEARPVDWLDRVIAKLWKGSTLGIGMNTWEIARFAKVDECAVANRLAVLRDTGKL